MAAPNFPELEKKILQDWQANSIFQKTLEQTRNGERFVFFEGPPTANGKPHMGHVETRAFKDVVLRYKTMRGFFVERKAGWDTQGLPVELEVEKSLGISGKKDIEAYGVEKFNAEAKQSVWKYKDLWEKMTDRVGFWLDTSDPYITYSNDYIETLWWIFKQIWDQKLLIQDYKVVPYCPRCGTALSSHEVAQGYESVTEPAVYVKFELVDEPGTFVLAWTTTPWTLPGNVALAVDEKIEYSQVTVGQEKLLLASALVERAVGANATIEKSFPGKELLGKKYKPLFDFLDLGKESGKNAYVIVPADFVTTEDGTGVVHTAVMYGVDDFQLGQKLDLPKIHTVDEAGKFTALVKPWDGQEVRDPDGKTQAEIIAWLQAHHKLYKVEDYTHDYPFCWRCKHPLLYYAKTSWFILMSKLLDQLIKNNEKVNWSPAHIKDGRFGEWLREVKDWAISRERYWGTPLPIWECNQCKHQECLGSYQELLDRLPARNRYIFIRHGESENNVTDTLDTMLPDGSSNLTAKGRAQSATAAEALQSETVDAIFTSQFPRARQTAAVIAEKLKLPVTEDQRLNEFQIGPKFEGKTIKEFHQQFGDRTKRLSEAPPGGETWLQLRQRMIDFLHELDAKHTGKTFVIVSHADPIYVAAWAASLRADSQIPDIEYPKNAEPYEVKFVSQLFQPDGSFDPHRPYSDTWTWPCAHCQQGTMRRVPEVADTWFDSGSMPFAQWHYPFENTDRIKKGKSYPADYITEAIDQTRGWFYTLLAIATLLQKSKAVKAGPPYKNVVVLGHVRDAKGKKLSKSAGNYIDPLELIDQHGADPIRFYLMTMNQPGDPKNFDPKGLDEVIKKTFLILMNVVSFWKLYAGKATADVTTADHPLDRWILAKTAELTKQVTDGLEAYDITGAGRSIASCITDLSTWYVRRSRDRIKGDDRPMVTSVLRQVLMTLAQLLAPFTPFLAEQVYREVGGRLASVHLEPWPASASVDRKILEEMQALRQWIEQGHALRAQAGLKVRQPLQQFVVAKSVPKELHAILRAELNVKEIHDQTALPEGPEWVKTDRVALDTTLTDELKAEGMLRDLVREFNALRKTAQLQPSDIIVAHVQPQTVAAQVVERFAQQFLKEVRAKAATPSVAGAAHTAAITLDGQSVMIGLSIG